MWWAVGNLKSLIGLVVEVWGCITWVMGGCLGVSKPIFPIAKKNDLDMKTTPSPPTLFFIFSGYKKPSPPPHCWFWIWSTSPLVTISLGEELGFSSVLLYILFNRNTL